MTKLSVIIPVGGLTETDPYRQRSKQWVLRRWAALFPDAQICLGSSNQEPYSRPQARNNAFGVATADFLVVADADTIFHARQIHEAIRLIRGGAPWVVPYGGGEKQGPSNEGRYYNLNERSSTRWLNRDPDVTLPEPIGAEYDHKLNSWAGLLVMPRSAWETVGGYSEETVGWGADDVIMKLALDALVGPHERVHDAWTAHIWHPRGDADFSQPNWPHNAELLRKAQWRYG